MPDRRRTPRYVLSTPVAADVMALEDVTVEHLAARRMVVVAAARHDVNDRLIVHLPTGNGVVSHETRVLTSDPVSIGGAVHFRLELMFEAPPSQGDAR